MASASKRARIRKLFYTIDVLTDGSEWTGNGSVFLSVYKEAPCADESMNGEEGCTSAKSNDESQATQDLRSNMHMVPPPLARYAFGSLPDLTSRLAFDQRYSLAATKAFFQLQHELKSANHGNTPQCQGFEGLPALLLNLHHAGAEQLTLVSASMNESTLPAIQDTIELILPSHRSQHPKIQLCRVPELQNSSSESTSCCWWMVYRDDYIVVHAKRADSCDANTPQSTANSVIYLVTLLCHDVTTPDASLVVVSGTLSSDKLEAALQDLPVIDGGIDNHEGPKTAVVAWGLSIHGQSSESIPPHIDSHMAWFYARPCAEGTLDPGLLVRAQQQSKAWHASKPQWFPWTVHETHGDDEADAFMQQLSKNMTRLRTGWSVVLSTGSESALLDRIRQLKHDTTGASDRSSWLMQCDFRLPSSVDENEIDLDDENDEHGDEAAMHVQTTASSATCLLILGTGCAAPSPYRGSSGYCLLLKDNFTFVFEVGDGFLTQWHRYSSRSLLSIRVIWISHAHWDHYGGLAALLLKLADIRQEQQGGMGIVHVADNRKRQRLDSSSCTVELPLLVASGKVLKYLALFLGDSSKYFRGINMGLQTRHACDMVCRLTTRSNGAGAYPIAFFDIVRVDHSCADSFGFVIGLRRERQQSPFVFCFSGDTRPCSQLVRSCRSCGEQWSEGEVDVLLHEATFDQTEAKMSIAKKHSTVIEAIGIGKSMRARRVFLTHFSQRYNSPPDRNDKVEGDGSWSPVLDGSQVLLFTE